MGIDIRNVDPDEGALLRSLAAQCAPLDLHTPYTYWVIAHYYSQSCFTLTDDGEPVGFITSLVQGDRGFIWQIGLLAPYRKRGLSQMLIDAVVSAFSRNGIKEVELTISDDNPDSFGAFSSYCVAHGLFLRKTARQSSRMIVRRILNGSTESSFVPDRNSVLITQRRAQ